MTRLIFSALLLLSANLLFAQSNVNPATTPADYNLGFESFKPDQPLPEKWSKFALNRGYHVMPDSLVKHSGRQSLRMELSDTTGASRFACVSTTIPAIYEGKQIELRAWVKIENVSEFMGLMLRIDNEDNDVLAFENLQRKRINGSKDWALYSVKLNLPKDAVTIFAGPILAGTGKLWIDDVQLLVDGKDLSAADKKANYVAPQRSPYRYGSNAAAAGKVKLKDVELYYESYGQGEPLLLLHGNSQSIYYFKKQITELSKHNRVIAVDTRAQGKSKDASTGELTYDLFAEDMRQLMDALHIKKANILGWSDGGNTGLIMAIKYPEYVNKLAVMGAVLFPSDQSVGNKVLKQMKDVIRRGEGKTDPFYVTQRRLYNMLLKEPQLTFEQIKAIKSPVLVMAGEHDIVLEKHTKAIAAHIPNAELLIFKDANHYIPVEKPKVFNEAVMRFLTN